MHFLDEIRKVSVIYQILITFFIIYALEIFINQ